MWGVLMAKFMLKRILSAVPTLIIVLSLVFILMRVIPGNPLYSMTDEDTSAEDIKEMSDLLGFNDPIWEQYLRYIGNTLRGDWGKSYFNGLPVFENIRSRLEPTIMITIFSTIITIIIGVPVGVIAATHRNSWLDYSLSSASVVFLTIPSFWLGILMVYFLAFKLGLFPTQGYAYIAKSGFWKALHYVTMPSLTLGLTHVASIARQTRSAMLNVISEDYIRTARAKGFSDRVVYYKHALKNTLSLIFTLIATSIAGMLGGSTIIEKVFNINGVGKLAYESLMRRDYSQEQAIILFMSLIFIGMNIILDILYKLIDPRVDFG